MRPTERIHSTWNPIKPLLNRPELIKLRTEILPNAITYPKTIDTFRAFSIPLPKVNVVILGQDPYHGSGQATGLAFSVNKDIPIPPSLRIIKKEVINSGSIGTKWGANSVLMDDNEWKTLNHWENQGVMLLNTALTVESSKPGSHLYSWKEFTKKVIHFISSNQPTIWFLWGAKAKAYLPYIREPYIVDKYDESTIKDIPILPSKNYVFTASHPASEVYKSNAGFLGCNHFRFANEILEKKSKNYINW